MGIAGVLCFLLRMRGGSDKIERNYVIVRKKREEKDMDIRDYLKEHKILADGAFGTYFASLEDVGETVSEWANLKKPDVVAAIHREYIEAGARLLRSNTFGASRAVLGATKEEQRECIRRGYEIARQAADKACEDGVTGEKEPIFVAADIGPIPEDLNSTRDELLKEYTTISDIFLEAGAKIFLMETFSEFTYIEPLARHIRKRCPEAFIMAQFSLNRYGYTKLGVSAARLLKEAGQLEELDCVGFNCGIGAGHLYQLMKKLCFPSGKYLSAFPNSGYPELMQNRTSYLDNHQYFAEKLGELGELGLHIIGGCCGTTPRYIEAAGKTVDLSPAGTVYEVRDKEESHSLKTGTNAFYNKLAAGQKVIAVELDPPYDCKYERIMECANILKAAGIDMLTFADSPMGRGRVDSILMSVKVLNEVGIPVMPHVACRDKNAIGMRAGLLGGYVNGIRNLLIVTGDPVPSSDRAEITSVFDFHSIRLMEFVRQMNMEHFSEEPVYYGGALNYGRAGLDREIDRMKDKISAGASYFLTQPIFSEEDIERIRYIKSKVDTRILCGIMPLVSYRNASFVKNEITGICVPEEVVNAFSPEMTREEGERVGVQLAREMIKKLSPIADGYYFMLPFNRVHLIEQCLED